MVDDDPKLCAAMRRHLGREFDLETASSAGQALEKLKNQEYAVVVSDLRMPGMDGIQFLSQVQKTSPDTVRIMLTGYADIHAVLDAVNQGAVFRFLTKPCPPENLRAAMEDGLRQHRRVLAERELHALAQVRTAMESVIFAFAGLVEARDPYTAGHQRRVAELSRAIALKMKLEPERVEAVYLASMVHDLGKVSVPAAFLNKPGRLSEVEYQVIKTHSEVGHQILSPMDFQWPLGQIVLQHHERLDGSGYPQGLKGGQILMESRIVAVADVVEAMSSHRPYRPSLGLEAGLAEIEDKVEMHYDPQAVGACLALFREDGWQFADTEPANLRPGGETPLGPGAPRGAGSQ